MQEPGRQLSKRTIAIGSARLIVFAIGIALILALLACFALEMLSIKNDAIGKVFGWVVLLFVCDAGALVLLRVAFAFSARRDRTS